MVALAADPGMFDRMIEVDAGDVRLTCGVAGEGPLVLCAHGFPDTFRTYREQIPALRAAGYQIASVCMRGYAPSSPSRLGRYDVPSLGRDLCAVAKALSPDQPVRLLGHDWGAIAAYAATALRPDRFSHLVTMAVPHFRVAAPRYLRPSQWRRSWYVAMFQFRGLAERRVLAKDMAVIEQLWRDWSPGYLCPPEEMAFVKAALRPHFSGVLDYYRAAFAPAGLLGEARRLLFSRTDVPAMYVHGEQDGCVGVELCRGIESAYLRGVETLRVPKAGHFVHLEEPVLVNRKLLSFFG
jgi:pimeloyl-ACP methyl ester carboxylesterase